MITMILFDEGNHQGLPLRIGNTDINETIDFIDVGA